MTQEWVYRFNEKCAEFLGYVNTTPTDKVFSIYEKKGGEFGKLIETMSMNFHSDWNWIMEIVEKIETINCDKQGNFFFLQISRGVSYITTDVTMYINKPWIYHSGTKKEATIKAVNQFIDWYNEQKK